MCVRKLLSLLLALCLTAFVGVGCSEDGDDGNSGSKQSSGGSSGFGGGGGGGGGVGMCYDENNCEEVPDYGGGDDDPQPGDGDKDGKCDAGDQCDVENGTRWRCEGNPNGSGQIATGFLCVKGCYKQKVQKKCTKGCFKAETDCTIPGY